MISGLGFLATGNQELADALRRTLMALAENQTARGLMPSLAHDPADRGSSDATPLFLFGLALYRKSSNQPGFLDEAAQKALKWMQSQRPCLAVCLRILCGGMRGGGADGPGEAETVSADRTGEALARKRGGVGFQRVDQSADRSAQRARLADLIGRYVPLRGRMCRAAGHPVLRRDARGRTRAQPR